MKKRLILPFLFLLLITFNAQAASSADLVGLWKNNSVYLNLKKNGKYDYKLNALVSFSGKWTATAKKITLHYSMAGFKKKKIVRYDLSGNELTIKKKDRPSVKLKRSK